MTNLPPLTPAAIATLRASVRWRGTVGSLAHLAQIVWLEADGAFGLIVDGRIMATSADIALLGQCLRQERAERGFIARIMDTATDAEVASLDPAGRAERARQNAAFATTQRAQREEADAKRRDSIRRGLTDVGKLSLEDLL